MRWFLIYYVIGLVFELANLARGWDRTKDAVDRMLRDNQVKPIQEAPYTALMFIAIPVFALIWPIGLLLKLSPKLTSAIAPAKVRKYLDK